MVMTRERVLVESLVELADTLVDDYDIIDFMQTLSERCVELLDVAGAGIMLAGPTGMLRHVACSSEQMRLIELFELQVEQGPCFDAYREATSVLCDSTEDAVSRWPDFAPHAANSGFVAMSAVPMRLRDQTIGALNLFASTRGALTVPDERVAQAMADIATIGILQQRTIRDHQTLSNQLELALESRVFIEQAKGIVAEHLHIDVDNAFALIRRYARDHNRLLTQTAQELINATLRAEKLSRTSQTP
jgi:GAF domain-containing protein